VSPPPDRQPSTSDIAIVGAGFAGLGAAIKLKQSGRHDLVIFEQAAELGGTWRDNSYPGCACDVPSHLYSYSFAPNPDWSDTFSGQADIWAYLRRCAEDAGLAAHLRLSCRVEGARWDEAEQRWRITTAAGEHVARVLIVATGPLSEPSVPAIPGLESFAGTVFHSARWRHDHDLTGRRVAVIGTGASAAQFVPAIQPAVGRLHVFQRTPAWVLPRRSRPLTRFERALYHRVPGTQRVARTLSYWTRELMAVGFLHPAVNRLGQRIALTRLRRQVPDPALRAKLTPDYVLGCKRVVLSNDYLPAVAQSNVELVTESIREVRRDGVVTEDGLVRQVDTIILGTGFRVTEPPMYGLVTGRDGRTLAQACTPTMKAHRGTMVAGFPNLFVLLGPNTGLGHSSVVLMVESQLRHIRNVLDHADRLGVAALEPSEEAQRRWTALVDQRMRGTVWVSGGCRSWYLDATGRNSTIWPGYATGFRLRLNRLRPHELTVPGQPAGPGDATSILSGQTVFVTGAARGIGEHVARLAAQRGARLFLVGLEPDRLAALAEELDAGWCECDVTDQAALTRAVEKAIAMTGRIDVVVANAGIINMGTVASGDIEALARTVDVNLTGVMRTVSATVPHVKNARGYYLLISSAAAFTALPGMAAYCASKAGVEHFGNALRLELADAGARVGTAHPSWIDTDLVRDARRDLATFREAQSRLPWPMNRTVPVQQCARALVRAIERRSRRVYVPGPVAGVQGLRTLVNGRLAQALLVRGGRDRVVRMEDEVRSLGRSFGEHSAGLGHADREVRTPRRLREATISFERRGAGEPLVLLHGIGHRWQAWLPVMDRLARHHEVIAIDMPGFGASPLPLQGRARSVSELVEAVQEQLAALGLERPHLAGNSLGGAVALELACAGAAASVTALAPAGFCTPAEARRAFAVLTTLRTGTFSPQPALRWAASHAWVRDLALGTLVAEPSRLDPDRLVGDSVSMRQGKGYLPIGWGLRRYTFAGSPDVPVTVAWGERDRILRPAQAQRARSVLPAARHVSLPGCGHVPMSDAPELVAQVILETTRLNSTVA
jgi:cation diffusion facilitator CzcD-associated flavoprotein CzcO/NAD(P)-dependent dehydrogenase (short-subunit alcohol dehydrogenase family)/pimeloyl-ACP methyl ester carboxylesterase